MHRPRPRRLSDRLGSSRSLWETAWWGEKRSGGARCACAVGFLGSSEVGGGAGRELAGAARRRRPSPSIREAILPLCQMYPAPRVGDATISELRCALLAAGSPAGVTLGSSDPSYQQLGRSGGG